MAEKNEDTTVDTVDIDLNEILNMGASVMLPTEKTESKNNVFSRKTEDISFLDKPIVDDPADTDSITDPEKKQPATISSTEFEDILNTDVEDDEDTKKPGGRSKVEKNGLIELANKLIEKKFLVPFDDEKPIDKYTLQDFEDLIEANFSEKEKKLRGEVPAAFFQGLPPEFQYAHQYIQSGGKDLKGLFKSLAAVEEVRQMDPSDEADAKHIVRSYLQATNFGDTDEIEEEIVAWEDRDELENKAKKFKPKLDAMTEKQVQYKLQQQEVLRQQQAAQADIYMDNIYKVLEPGEINGLKLDRKTQNLLFSGLVQPNYASVSGQQTNLLGHLLEKHQYVEPNHALIAEALWLLADPDGYKSKVRENNKKEVVATTVRQLKSEEGRKIASHVQDDEKKEAPTYKIPKVSGNFFKR